MGAMLPLTVIHADRFLRFALAALSLFANGRNLPYRLPFYCLINILIQGKNIIY